MTVCLPVLWLRQYYRDVLLTQELLAICSIARTCLSSSKTMHQHIALVTQSSFCTVRHLSSSVLTCDQPTVVTLTRLITASERHGAEVCIPSTNSRYARVAAAAFETWAEFQQSVVDDEIDQWRKKDQKRISMCCGVDCLTFKLPIQPALFTATMVTVTQHNSPFSEPLTFGEKRMSSVFHKVMRWHFTGVMGKFTITVAVRFTLRYVNNQKIIRST